MIGPEFLSTFQLKPIETILDWENARRWKVYFESEIYRRRCLESTAVASEDSSTSVDSLKSDVSSPSHDSSTTDFSSTSEDSTTFVDQTTSEDSTTTKSPAPVNLSAPENLIDTAEDSNPNDSANPSANQNLMDTENLIDNDSPVEADDLLDYENPTEADDLDDTEDYSSAGMRRRRYSDVPLPETLTMELTLNEVVHILDVMTNYFDRNHWSMVEGDLMKEIRFRMRRQGFRNRDLVEEIGSKGYVSDILNRRKPLTLRTARIFRDFFDIPAEWLLNDCWDGEVPDCGGAAEIVDSRNRY
jgi:HTH-type transcriptional regulator/antitoxin HigA